MTNSLLRYSSDFWNWLQLLTIGMVLTNLGTRLPRGKLINDLISDNNLDDLQSYAFIAGRILIAISIFLFYLQILQFYSISNYMGPKVLTMIKMV